MYEKELLMLPGPTPVPPRVLRALSQPMINHRGPVFRALLEEVTEGVKMVYQTKNDVFLLPTSGTGAMEAAVANFINAGDKVLAISIGNFGDRFATIAAKYGAQVDKIESELGRPFDPDVVAEKIAADKEKTYKAILVTHNETSTGVFNDLKLLKKIVGDHPALLLVDAVSGLGVMDLKTDEWGLDVVLAGAQKAFMVPPGISFISVSEKAWKVHGQCTSPRFYWDVTLAKQFAQKGETLTTPAISQIFALKESLKIFKEQGLEKMFEKQAVLKALTRAGVEAAGMELFVEDAFASAAVTTVKSPANIEPKAISKKMREDFNVVIAGGQGKLTDTTFRIGHLGYVQPLDILMTIGALEMTLYELGMPVALGAGVKAVQDKILSIRKGA